MSGKRNVSGNDVVVNIPTEGDAKAVTEGGGLKGSSSWEIETAALKETRMDSASQASTESGTSVATPEIASLSPSRNKPPKAPNANESLIWKRSLNRSMFSKPKSRFAEQLYPFDATVLEEEPNALLQEQVGGHSPFRASSNQASPSDRSMHSVRSGPVTRKSRLGVRNVDAIMYKGEPNAFLQEQAGGHSSFRGSFNQASPNDRSTRSGRNVPVTPETPLTASPGPAGGGGGEEDDEEICKQVTLELSKAKYKRIKNKALVEWTVFLLILGCLVASLTVDQLEASKPWGLEIWKWCVLMMVLFSGMLVTNWVMHFIISLIERKFLLQKKILYFVDGIQVFTWLAFILLTWVLLFNRDVKRSNIANKVLDYITWTLVSILIGSFLWFLKTLLLKILALSFHITTFFDRIRESIFHRFVLQTLSRWPLKEEAYKRMGKDPSAHQFNFRTMKKGKMGVREKVIDAEKILKMKQKDVSVLTMNMLIDMVRSTSLFNILTELDESDDRGVEQVDEESMTEEEVLSAAHRIFENIAQLGCEYLEEEDLRKFMINEVVDLFFLMFEGGETGRRINKISFMNWVVKVCRGHKALLYALIDTKTAVKQLNKVVTGILIVTTIIIWLLLMEIATTNILLLLSSQLVMAAFIFGDTCKKIFEGIIFVFVTHPFDDGDQCIIDGVQLMVEEMSILTTVFLTSDHDKIYYPNSVLATKPIINYHRSPDLGDKVEFFIEFMTPLEKIGAMKEEIKKYLEENPQHWHTNPKLFVCEKNLNKIKMGLYVNHKMNFQDYAEKNRRRTKLVLRLKEIFDVLSIRYDLLPRGVHLCHSENKKQA